MLMEKSGNNILNQSLAFQKDKLEDLNVSFTKKNLNC